MFDYKEKLAQAANALSDVNEKNFKYFTNRTSLVPNRKTVVDIIKFIQSMMFPDYFPLDGAQVSHDERMERLYILLRGQIKAAYTFLGKEADGDIGDITCELISKIPVIKEKLIKDAIAIYEGDPAARNPEEVILCYPGFYAISIYRIAHEFYLRGIPFISRLMTEFAHEKTGVDIHAGATVGEYFCIDHGTGIVVGETATIGDRVKIYQGVTLGAKSFEIGEDGNPVKGIKRHPDIGNGVVIYANATILGGDTKVGDGAVIGGNVWLTSSVEPGVVVHYGKNKADRE